MGRNMDQDEQRPPAGLDLQQAGFAGQPAEIIVPLHYRNALKERGTIGPGPCGIAPSQRGGYLRLIIEKDGNTFTYDLPQHQVQRALAQGELVLKK